MIVVPDYRDHRIEVNAVAVDGRWNAEVRIRRTLSSEKPYVVRVTRYKLTAEPAERAGEIWARAASCQPNVVVFGPMGVAEETA